VCPVDYGAFREEWFKQPVSVSLQGPTDKKFTVGSHAFDAPEYVFFQQEHLARGVADCIARAGGAAGDTILLSGKNTLFPGLADRLGMELRALGVTLPVSAPPNRVFMAYTNVTMHLGKREELYVTKERYDEVGPFDVLPHLDSIVFP
jgi:actin-related protein